MASGGYHLNKKVRKYTRDKFNEVNSFKHSEEMMVKMNK